MVLRCQPGTVHSHYSGVETQALTQSSTLGSQALKRVVCLLKKKNKKKMGKTGYELKSSLSPTTDNPINFLLVIRHKEHLKNN